MAKMNFERTIQIIKIILGIVGLAILLGISNRLQEILLWLQVK